MLDECLSGRIWLGNDGGIVSSYNCGNTWEMPYTGPKTLIPVNLAGVALSGKPPVLYMGTGDNDDFVTMDGGKIWGPAHGGCGDCGHWFADPAVPNRVMEIGADGCKGQAFFIYTNPNKDYADTYDEDNTLVLPFPDDTEFPIINGARPLMLTVPTETVPSFLQRYGKYIVIRKIGDEESGNYDYYLLKAMPDILSLWISQGPKLPCKCTVYQSAAGTVSPVVFIGDGKELWKGFYAADDGTIKQWWKIVPGAFYTNDGITWHRLMDANALPCRPVSAYFDAISDPNDKSLFVACEGRGVLRIHPIM